MRSRFGTQKGTRFGVAVLVGGVILSLGLSACSSSKKAATTTSTTASAAASSSAAPPIPSGTIKLGIVAALSGTDSTIGNLVKNEFTAYTTYLNSKGGIAGHQVELIVENNQSDPTVAVTAAQKLISEGVVATFYNGSTAEAKEQVVALEQKAGIIGIAPESLAIYNDPKTYPLYFSDNALNSQVTDSLAAFAKKKGFDNFGVLGDSSPQANDYLTTFAKSAATAGLKVSSTTSYPVGATTMTTQLSTLKAAGAQTLALFCYAGCGQVFDSLRQIGWKPNVLLSPNIYYTALSSVKDYSTVSWSVCPFSVNASDTAPPQGVKDAVDAIAPALGGQSALDQVFAQTADAFLILKWAIEKVNSIDSAALKGALESMKGQSFTDPSVTYTFSSTTRSGYVPATSDKLIPICGLGDLGIYKLPIRVAS